MIEVEATLCVVVSEREPCRERANFSFGAFMASTIDEGLDGSAESRLVSSTGAGFDMASVEGE
jgi:hypothetical protein